MKLSKLFLCCSWLLFATFNGWAQSTTFSFTLDEPCKTSAAVYQTNGTLVRTLWSKVRYYTPGTYSSVWDGLDDNSNAVAAGTYQVKVLQHNTEYVWDGAVGNTSAEISGPTVHSGFWPMADMAISGTNAFYVSGYDEGKYDFRNFLTADPQHVRMAWYWVYSSQFNRTYSAPGEVNDLNWLWTAADSNWVYFACSGTPNPTNTSAANKYPGCIVVCNVGDNSPAYFTNGVQIINNGANSPLPSGIYVGTQPGLSGLAVQQNGNLLAASVAPDNRVYLFNKRTGVAVANFSVSSPGRLSFSPDGSLWVISGNSIIHYTNIGTNPSAVLSIPSFSEPLDVAVNPTNANLILVADGGGSQQIKAFDNTGASLWVYGQAGGYQANGAAVTTNKFWFYDGQNDETFLCFAPDGSFWVGDGGNNRSLHFSASLNYLEQIMYQPHSYNTAVDQNNPSRVFNQFLEFSVDYTKPLSQGWTLVNNWQANVPTVNISWNKGLYEVTTFTNGHTYALVDNNTSTFATSELCELGSKQLRLTGINPAWSANRGWISLGPDGSARRTTIGAPTWYQATLSGFDSSNNPVWNPETLIATASSGSTDPVPRGSSFGNIRASISTNNVLIAFDQSLNNGFHLGGINVGTSSWLWKASPAVSFMNGRGTYEIANGVTYGGNTLQAIDRNVIYGYHGEFFRGQGQAGQTMHFYDDGLFVGQFGEASPGHSAYEGALPGFSANGHCPNLTKTATGDYYLWVNDESDHGPQRWHLVNTRNIREQSGIGNLGGTITLASPASVFPTAVTGKNGNQTGELTWLPVPGATSYNLRYSTINGGPYTQLAGSTTSLDYVAGGLINGQTYYFAVTALQGSTESIPSEQVVIHPFDTTQKVLCAGSMSEGGQFTPVIDISSNGLAAGQPSYTGAEHYTGVLNLRELDYYGYGNLQNENVGLGDYAIYDWGGAGVSLLNISAPFKVTISGSGWTDINNLKRQFRVDQNLGVANGLIAGPTASISIGVNDTNYHYLTVVSPAQFNNARAFTMRLVSTNNTSAAFTINENPGYSHVFQFLFQGNVTLVTDASQSGGSGAIVQAIFLDNASITYQPTTSVSSQTASATTLVSSQNPALAGSSVTLTATVTGNGGPPTGTVVFYDGTITLGAIALNGSGTATLTTTALSSANSLHAITAFYGGNSTYTSSTSSALSQAITNAPTTNPGTNSHGLSGQWQFDEGFGTTTADSSGNGNIGTLNSGPTWVAGYQSNGALQFPGSSVPGAAYVSVPKSLTLADQGIGSNLTICAWVKRSAASIGNYCSIVANDVRQDSAPYHRNYELIFDSASHISFAYRNIAGTTWEIYSSSATFTDQNWHFYGVTYSYGNSSSCQLYVDGSPVSGSWVSGNGSDAPASTSGNPILIGIDGTGTTSRGSTYDAVSIYTTILSSSAIRALFTGTNNAPSTAPTFTALNSSQNPALAGSSVTFTATVNGSGGTPSGIVMFLDGNSVLGSNSLNASAMASFTTSSLSATNSPHAIAARYSGDSNFTGSTSPALSQTITNSRLAANVTLASSQNPSAAGNAIMFTATVNGSRGSPAGSIIFYDGGNNIGSGTLNAFGVATFSTAALSVSNSPHSMVAAYSGDNNYTAGNSSALSQMITNANTTTNVNGAAQIALTNPSFENPAGTQGKVPGTPIGWAASNGNKYGVWNPAAGIYANQVNDVLPSPAQGSQVLWIDQGNYIAQFLTNTLASSQTYTLSGAIGNRGDGYGMVSSDQVYVNLVVGNTIVAQNANVTHPAPGTFLPWTISYTTPASSFPAGTLQIRLGQNGVGEVNFDNLSLTVSPSSP